MAARGRAPHVEPGDDRAAAARGPARRAADVLDRYYVQRKNAELERDNVHVTKATSKDPFKEGDIVPAKEFESLIAERQTKIQESVYQTLTEQYELAKVQEAKERRRCGCWMRPQFRSEALSRRACRLSFSRCVSESPLGQQGFFCARAGKLWMIPIPEKFFRANCGVPSVFIQSIWVDVRGNGPAAVLPGSCA